MVRGNNKRLKVEDLPASSSASSLSILKWSFLSLPDKLFFSTIPPFGALERDRKHLATAIED